MSLPEPNFIARDPQAITAELVAQYETITGKTLYPAQIERLLIDLIAYRETLVRVGIQEAAKQNLVAYARAPMIDYLGELVGVTRLPAQPARTVLRFSIETALEKPLPIPAGTRVETGDGGAVFATDLDATLATGQTALEIPATGLESGEAGNGWQTGQIAHLVDDLGEAEVVVINAAVSAGGLDAEDDDRLRERIRLAPEAFSVAGSRLAYRFHALSAHQGIADVAVLSPTPGQVKLYPLLGTGLPDAGLLALVEAACSGERIRPLTDQVLALAPEPVDYALVAQLTLDERADRNSTLAAARTAVQALVTTCTQGLGRNVVTSQVIAALQVPGVYRVDLIAPAVDIHAEAHQWAHCTGIELTVAGARHG